MREFVGVTNYTFLITGIYLWDIFCSNRDFMDVVIRENSWLGRLAAWKLKSAQVAIVFNNVVHLWGVGKETFLLNRPWTRHEVAHVYQYKKYGFVRFILLYLVESAYKGYHNNRFEAEARNREDDQTI